MRDPAGVAIGVDSSSRSSAPTGRPFIGRARDLQSLHVAWADVLTGEGGLVLLSGEAGIGKSRLAGHFAAQARAEGARVLWGRCWEVGGAPAYWPWIQALRDLVSDLDAEALTRAVGGSGPVLAQLLPELRERMPGVGLPQPASAESARFRLFDRLAGFLARVSTAEPLVLVLEDIHAADASSLLLLQFIATGLGGTRLLVVATYRDAEPRRDRALADTLPELARGASTLRISLSGFTPADVAHLVQPMTGHPPPEGLVAAIHRETEGNPLFVEELVRLLLSEGGLREPEPGRRWPIPEGVREVIGRRLGQLSKPCRDLLTIGAVIGRDFSTSVLASVTGGPPQVVLDGLGDAVTARLLTPVDEDPGRFRFGHALVREALYDTLPPAERVRLHRSLGEAIEESHAGDLAAHVAELAHHFFEAAPDGDPSKGVDYAEAAGQRAVEMLAYEEGIRLFRMALRGLQSSPGERRRCELLLRLGDAQGRAGNADESKATFLEAANAASRIEDSALLGQAALGYAGRFPWIRAGADREVVPLIRRALSSMDAADSPLRARLMSRLAGALRDQAASEPRGTLASEALAMARRLGDPDTLTYALLGWWGATLLGPDGVAELDGVADELDRLADDTGDRELRTNAMWVRFIAFLSRGQAREARAQQELMARLFEELGQPAQKWYGGCMATGLALQDGRFEEGERLLEATWETGRRAMPWDAEAARMFARFLLYREQGRLAALEGELHRALRTHAGYRSVRCMILTLLCEVDRLDEARLMFAELAADEFARFPKDNEWLFAMTLLAEAADVLGAPTPAEVLYRHLRPYAELIATVASEVSIGPVSRPLGLLAALMGRHHDAATHFDSAIAQAGQMGARPWAAHAQHDYARMLLALGRGEDKERVAGLLEHALETCETLGMPILGGRTRDLLQRLGRRPGERRAGLATAAAALTRREREVAGLVTEGLTNRQIAERLFVAERTAESHVQHILTKLGFTSRVQVAAWAVREELAREAT
jgi:DNA-binding CsgD family transcriptional regulator/tetratricopeptide (TPR) repeat protein